MELPSVGAQGNGNFLNKSHNYVLSHMICASLTMHFEAFNLSLPAPLLCTYLLFFISHQHLCTILSEWIFGHFKTPSWAAVGN